MTATYNYIKYPVDIDSLTEEILSSEISSSTFDSSSFNTPDNLYVTFSGALSAYDEGVLDTVVSGHLGVPNYDGDGLIAITDGSGGINFVEADGVPSITNVVNTTVVNTISTSSGVEFIKDESGDILDYLNINSIVHDPNTSISGTFLTMQVMMNRRELYNDTDSPIYIQGFTPLLGASGTVQSIQNDVTAINTALGKNGWYTQYIKNWTYPNPQDLLIYYGWLNSFNSATNSWNNELVAQDMAKYNYIVLGDGIQSPSHGDYANTEIIVPRIKVLNQHAQIFGYVTANQSLSNFQTKVDEWDALYVDGIFIDEAGYDYGVTRSGLNDRIDYVHGKTYANICFANAWNIDHVLGTDNDISYPNTTWNPDLIESNLTSSDWYLLESYPINTTAYSSTGGYESKSDWVDRGTDAVLKRYEYGINLAAVGIINNDNVNGQDLFNFGFVSAMTWNLEVFGTSDTSYGAGSAIVTRWDRPNTEGLGREWAISPSVQMDYVDNDKYHRYLDFGRLTLDFSNSAQTADIERFTPIDVEKVKFNAGDLTEGSDSYPAKSTATGHPVTGLAFDRLKEEAMYGMFEVPSKWKHGTDVTVKLYFLNDYSQSGDTVCRWAVTYEIYNDLDTVGSKTPTSVSDNCSLPTDATEDTFIQSSMTISYNDANNPITRDSMLSFRVFRDSTDPADTMSNDAIMVLLVFEFEKEDI